MLFEGDAYEWDGKLAAAVWHENAYGTEPVHGRPIRHGSAEYGDTVYGPLCQPAVRVEQICHVGSDLHTAELWPDDLGHLAKPVPEHLCPIPGEPEIPTIFRPAEGSEKQVF